MNESSHRTDPQPLDQSTIKPRLGYWRLLYRQLAVLYQEHYRSRRLVDFFFVLVVAGLSGAAVWVSCCDSTGELFRVAE